MLACLQPHARVCMRLPQPRGFHSGNLQQDFEAEDAKDLFLIAHQVINVFNLFVTYGDTFLPDPDRCVWRAYACLAGERRDGAAAPAPWGG